MYILIKPVMHWDDSLQFMGIFTTVDNAKKQISERFPDMKWDFETSNNSWVSTDIDYLRFEIHPIEIDEYISDEERWNNA